jgi:hypothetical protein
LTGRDVTALQAGLIQPNATSTSMASSFETHRIRDAPQSLTEKES